MASPSPHESSPAAVRAPPTSKRSTSRTTSNSLPFPPLSPAIPLNSNGANAFSNGLQLNPPPPPPPPPDQTSPQNERRSGHFPLSPLFAFDSRPSGSIFRASPETVRTGAERRPHFSLWKMRFSLHG